ncbi:uncharacterized protein BJ171DRAFT_510302 [Polychytrium aggregatum]|uniref:uncharacterized protein n=1 Tax=Polychytrium aggregatum TaxID=110093 RepID=UPI0022FE8160|nr:uncharacterized protein BJ171DRAFT_510302 [Polychytrium aggregatum]KAI9203299.1 hypothetical protein BJ171DRAFT_510302 [Polychytrium aggregatum]
MSRLANKIVLVTGASSGIGEATAREFARAGSHLIVTARRVERLQDLKNKLSQEFPAIRVLPVEMDVRSRDRVFKAIEDLPVDFKDIDVLVNNAGLVIGMDTIENVKPEAIDTMIDTNVKGLLNVTQAVLPGMKHRKRGHIINISSIAGTEAYANGGIYCASKHAVQAITRSLRMELVGTPLNVTSIEPGLVETEFSVVRFGGDKSKADRVYEGLEPLTGQDIAETVVFAAGRPPHVQIASMVVFPTSQAAVHVVSRQ